MKKSRAFLIHLSISATIVAIVFALIFFVWYPYPYFEIVGAGSILKILIGVDLVAGPVLTLILYKPGKPGLLFDLSFIAVIQLAALIYGTTIIYQERPYFVVFAVDRFEVLAYTEIDPDAIPNAALREKPLVGPIMAVAVFPESEKERQALLNSVFAGKPDIERRPEYWDLYANHFASIVERAIPLTKLADQLPDARDKINAFIRSRTDVDELIGIPVVGKKGVFNLVLNKTTQRPVGVIDFDLWEASARATPSAN